MAAYDYIFQKLQVCMEVLVSSPGSSKDRLRRAISTGVLGMLRPTNTHLPEAIAPRLTAFLASVDHLAAGAFEQADEATVEELAAEILRLYTFTCHMRGPEHA